MENFRIIGRIFISRKEYQGMSVRRRERRPGVMLGRCLPSGVAKINVRKEVAYVSR